jgi:hypothetical protein
MLLDRYCDQLKKKELTNQDARLLEQIKAQKAI